MPCVPIGVQMVARRWADIASTLFFDVLHRVKFFLYIQEIKLLECACVCLSQLEGGGSKQAKKHGTLS